MFLIIYKAVSRKLTTTKRTKTKNLEENHFKVYHVMEVEQLALPQSDIMFHFSRPKVFWCSLEYLGNPSKTWANFSKPLPTQYCAANAQSKTVKTRSSKDEYSTGSNNHLRSIDLRSLSSIDQKTMMNLQVGRWSGGELVRWSGGQGG